MTDEEQWRLTRAARKFAEYKTGKGNNMSAAHARAFRELIDAARAFAIKSDEEWAAEVIAARKERE
jgi:hypothetical protein